MTLLGMMSSHLLIPQWQWLLEPEIKAHHNVNAFRYLSKLLLLLFYTFLHKFK